MPLVKALIITTFVRKKPRPQEFLYFENGLPRSKGT